MRSKSFSSVAAEFDDSLRSLDAIYEYYLQHQWTDGLPIIPPTEDKVAAMLDYISRDPQEEIGLMPPKYGRLTLEKIAINAVMAGCKPEYMPVVVAAVEGMLDGSFNLNAVQVTTHSSAPLIVLNGPIRHEIEINCGANCFGQGWRANATIGRAVRLIMVNVGGASPTNMGDLSTFGTPAKYTYCVGEYEEENPWESLHVERGFPKDASTVTVFAAEAPHNAMCRTPSTPEVLLETVVDSIVPKGSHSMIFTTETMIVISPEPAALLYNSGWTKKDIRGYLFDRARQPVGKLKRGGGWPTPQWPKWIDITDDSCLVPAAERPEDFIILVAGGPGVHCLVIPPYGMSRSVTREIKR